MALFNCHECGCSVSTTAASCPNCGARINNTSNFGGEIKNNVCPWCGRPVWGQQGLSRTLDGRIKCSCGGVF